MIDGWTTAYYSWQETEEKAGFVGIEAGDGGIVGWLALPEWRPLLGLVPGLISSTPSPLVYTIYPATSTTVISWGCLLGLYLCAAFFLLRIRPIVLLGTFPGGAKKNPQQLRRETRTELAINRLS